jgi:alpha-ketoglutarate-dependent taurine dioxygenase
MAGPSRKDRLLLPADWLDRLCRNAYYTCNLGPLAEADLLHVARKLNSLGEQLAPGPLTQLTYAHGSPYRTLSRAAVPFHNDGAFRPSPPRYLILYCQTPGSQGGQTLFARGDEIVSRLDHSTRDLLRRKQFLTTLADSCATRRLLLKHPRDGVLVLFFGNPALTANLCVSAARGDPASHIVGSLQAILSDPRIICYRHHWKKHDLLVFDNFKVLHARTAYRGDRRLQRIEVGARTSRPNGLR